MKTAFTRIFYTFLLYLLVPVELVRLYWRGRISPDYRLRWRERFVITLPDVKKGGIWVHTASVGEFFAALPVVKKLLEAHPEQMLTVTTMTPTGSDLVKSELGDKVKHFYIPFDLPDAVRRFLVHLKPQKFLIMETELWPNIIYEAHHQGVEIILMNARLSERSARGYRYFQALSASILQKISVIAAQHEDDAERFLSLGANQSSVHITGNIKYDLDVESKIKEQGRGFRNSFNSNLVWIAASTHRGEDEQILDAHKKIRKACPDAQLILVPRHPERFNEVADVCVKLGLDCSRRSKSDKTNKPVYLADTMGELLMLYGAADIAFVGGSLVETGGHNLLEPAAHEKPILTGPYDFNFKDITRQMLESGGAIRVANSDELARQVILWEKQPEERYLAGKNAYSVVQKNQGALDKLLALIENQ